MQLLDQWNDNLEPEQKTKVLRENFLTLDKAIQGTNLLLLRNTASRVAQNISSSSYVALNEWQSAITSNGGLIVVLWETYVKYDGSGNISFQLVIDGGSQKEISGMGLAANNIIQNPFSWCGILNAGTHAFSFQAKVTGGTQIVGNTSSDSTLYVLEYMKG